MTTLRRVVGELGGLGWAVGDQVLTRVGRAAARYHEETPLPVDVLEGEEGYLVVFDAPGVTPSDVEVSCVGNVVEVRIDRFRGFRPGFDVVFPGRGMSFDGRAELPADVRVDRDAARATLRDDGTLRVFVPAAAPAE